MNDKVLVLRACQVWDEAKGCFFVGLEASKSRYRGHIIHTDKFGQRIVIVDGGK